MTTKDLSPQAPPGLLYFPGAVSSEDERRVLEELAPRVSWGRFTLLGQASRREIAAFGVRYATTSETPVPPVPFPDELLAIRERCAALAGVDPTAFGNALLTRYPAGAGIGWHRDFRVFGPVVLGVSLVGPARLKLRDRLDHADTYTLELAPRSLYVLAGEARSRWQHSLAPVKSLRYSVTFRSLLNAA
jgi:alkylated DNA repair dioxygenase AlkB